MKNLILLTIISSTAYGSHAIHNWQKISEQQGMNGQTICQWQCSQMGENHFTTTAGPSFCPRP